MCNMITVAMIDGRVSTDTSTTCIELSELFLRTVRFNILLPITSIRGGTARTSRKLRYGRYG